MRLCGLGGCIIVGLAFLLGLRLGIQFLNRAPQRFKVCFQAVDAALYLVDKSASALGRDVQKSEVVLIGLYLVLLSFVLGVEALASIVESVAALAHRCRGLRLEALRAACYVAHVERLVEPVHFLAVCLVEILLVLVGHVAGLLPFVHQFAHFLHAFLGGIGGDALKLLDDAALGLQVLLLALLDRRFGGFAGVEECVAGAVEAFPEFLGVFAGHGANLLPLFLQLLDGAGCLGPLRAVLEGFHLLAEGGLLLQVLAQGGLHALDELGLGVEECVAGLAEALEDLRVHILGCESDSLPFGLQGLYLVRHLVPLGVGLEPREIEGLHLLAERGLLLKILILCCTQFLEVFLMALVDDGGGGLEAIPYLLSQVFGYGADLAELLVELLHLVEGGDHVGLVGQFLHTLDDARLCLQVFLEVVLAELVVELEHVVEVLHVVLIVLPQLGGVLCRHGVALLPLGLQRAEFVVVLVRFLGRCREVLNLLEYLLLAFQVLLLLGLERLVILGAFLLGQTQFGLEALLVRIGHGQVIVIVTAVLEERLVLCFHFLTPQAIVGALEHVELLAFGSLVAVRESPEALYDFLLGGRHYIFFLLRVLLCCGFGSGGCCFGGSLCSGRRGLCCGSFGLCCRGGGGRCLGLGGRGCGGLGLSRSLCCCLCIIYLGSLFGRLLCCCRLSVLILNGLVIQEPFFRGFHSACVMFL